VEPARAEHIEFTEPYVEIEATYLVSGDSDIRTISEVDQPGVRIAIAARSAYDLYLSRNLQHAELIRAEGIDGSFDLFVGEGLDALAGLRPRLLSDVVQIENARILDGRFTAVQQAVGTPSDRTAGAAYLRDFVAEAKASGLITELIARHQVDGLLVAS
jgi:polar amino acid transport system substrate-binding protein